MKHLLSVNEDETRDYEEYKKEKFFKQCLHGLQLPPNASREAIEERKRELYMTNHPDRLIGLNLSESAQKERAESFMQTVTNYEFIKTYKKEKNEWESNN